MKTTATMTATSSMGAPILPPARRQAMVRRESQPILANDPDGGSRRDGASVRGPCAVHSSLTTRTTPDGARSVLATPRVPTSTVETPPAPKASSFAPRRRMATRNDRRR